MASRVEYDSLSTEDGVTETSVDVKTSSPDGIIYFAQQSDGGSDVMAVYLKEGQVIIYSIYTGEESRAVGYIRIQFVNGFVGLLPFEL